MSIDTELFLYFVYEREQIRLQREQGYPAPWTDDPILAKYKFCNVKRKDDRVSRWLLDFYYPKEPTTDDVWFQAAIARLINWPPSLNCLLASGVVPARAEDFDPKEFAYVLDLLMASGKVYGSAYMLYPGRETGVKKSQFTAERILLPLAESAEKVRYAVESNLVERVVQAVSSSFGMSTFMAGQVAADLTYLPGQLDQAMDRYKYAPIGPGSQRGLNWILGHPLTHAWKQDAFNWELMVLLDALYEKYGWDDLTLHDVQNCCCEFDKYCRVITDTGRPRHDYKPETRF